jgi:hypothetical protein
MDLGRHKTISRRKTHHIDSPTVTNHRQRRNSSPNLALA